MALPSGTFNRAISGPLQIGFSAQFDEGSDFGGSGTNSLYMLGTVTDGTITRTVPLSLAVTTAIVDWDYVADTTLTCSMSVVSYSTSTTGFVSASQLRIRAIFMKR